MLPFLKKIEDIGEKWIDKSGFRLKPWSIFLFGLVIFIVAFVFMPSIVSLALSLSLFLSPLWLPFLLIGGAISLWLILKRSEFIANQKIVLLEIKPPRNVVKTPLAMETFFSGMHHGQGENSWFNMFFKGSIRPWWSIEIASLEGQVHFYIWTRVAYRRIIESQLYAQYPGVQVTEAVDYTRTISATTKEWSIWGCDYAKTTAKQDALPIKTYVEYGLDKVQKELEQVDPFANLVEFMGSIGKGEYLWLQFIFRIHKGEKYDRKNDEGKK